jgi:hypothetical protein
VRRLPDLILNDLYDLDEEYVLSGINQASLDGSCYARFGGIRYRRELSSIIIIAWQCNMADIQNFVTKLPTVVRIHIDDGNIVRKVKLHESFKGSQGIPCAQKYLHRRLEQVMLGTEFYVQNSLIKDPLVFYCRHVYELVYGACAFVAYCQRTGVEDGFVSESTRAFYNGNSLECYDMISINGRERLTKIWIENFKGNIHYNAQGAIERSEGIEIHAAIQTGRIWVPLGATRVISAESNDDFVMKIMKIITGYWMQSGRNVGIKRHFYFSQIWAPTFYGIIAQAIALCIFNKNYAYFQHCISGIQRIDGRPCCIGVIRNIDEGQTFFAGFSPSDLY